MSARLSRSPTSLSSSSWQSAVRKELLLVTQNVGYASLIDTFSRSVMKVTINLFTIANTVNNVAEGMYTGNVSQHMPREARDNGIEGTYGVCEHPSLTMRFAARLYASQWRPIISPWQFRTQRCGSGYLNFSEGCSCEFALLLLPLCSTKANLHDLLLLLLPTSFLPVNISGLFTNHDRRPVGKSHIV